VRVRSLLSASDAPWQTGDLKEIHRRCGKNHFRKQAVVMKNFASRVEHILTTVNITVYQQRQSSTVSAERFASLQIFETVIDFNDLSL